MNSRPTIDERLQNVFSSQHEQITDLKDQHALTKQSNIESVSGHWGVFTLQYAPLEFACMHTYATKSVTELIQSTY